MTANTESRSISEDPSENLARCGDCGSTLSWNADKCPTCGAPNDLVHPRVTAFRDEGAVDIPHNTTLNHRGAKIEGKAETDTIWTAWLSGSLAGIAIAFGFVAVLLDRTTFGCTLIAIASGLHMLRREHVSKQLVKTFSIDFSKQPPAWESNDDQFWSALKKRYIE